MVWEAKREKMRSEILLEDMKRVVPWTECVKRIEPYYPKEKYGQPPKGLERMLRVELTSFGGHVTVYVSDSVFSDSFILHRHLKTKMVDGFGAIRSEMTALETRMNKEIMHMAWKTTAVLALLITILKFIH